MLKLRTKTYMLMGMSMLTLVPISTSCIWKWDKELTLKQVRDKTEVSIENISKLKINQVKKEQIKLRSYRLKHVSFRNWSSWRWTVS